MKFSFDPSQNFGRSILDWNETFVLCSLTPRRKTFHCAISSTVSRVCCDSTMFSICVFSAHLGNFKHIDSQSPDTACCHVWRACAWRLKAQGYLKGCANFALFTAPINPVCFAGCLCIVWMLDVGQSMANMQLCCLAFVCHWRLGQFFTDVCCPLWFLPS